MAYTRGHTKSKNLSIRVRCKWDENSPRVVYLLALLGATDKQVAEVIGVSIKTIELWKRKNPEFLEALNKGKLRADTKVVEAFYKCCTGYYYEEEEVRVVKGQPVAKKVTKYRQPDPWSCNKWLSLRQRGTWSEVTQVEIKNTNVNINKLDLDGITNEQLRLLRDIGLKQLKQPNIEELEVDDGTIDASTCSEE